MPAGLRLALQVGIRKAQLARLHGDARRLRCSGLSPFCLHFLDLPLHLGVQIVERHLRLFENAGQ